MRKYSHKSISTRKYKNSSDRSDTDVSTSDSEDDLKSHEDALDSSDTCDVDNFTKYSKLNRISALVVSKKEPRNPL